MKLKRAELIPLLPFSFLSPLFPSLTVDPSVVGGAETNFRMRDLKGSFDSDTPPNRFRLFPLNISSISQLFDSTPENFPCSHMQNVEVGNSTIYAKVFFFWRGGSHSGGGDCCFVHFSSPHKSSQGHCVCCCALWCRTQVRLQSG